MTEETKPRLISGEKAERIKNAFIPAQDRENTRPVIWPLTKIDELFDLLDSGRLEWIEKPQRNLAHIVCGANHIRLLIVRARVNPKENWYLLSIDDMMATHEFLPSDPINLICRILIGSERTLKACMDVSENRSLLTSGNVKLYTPSQYDEMSADEKAALAMAQVLEHYAFSPYTSYRERPTFQQALNPNPSKKKFSAIEIVNLRIPKRRDDAQATGRKINIRYEVSSHLRRQPTKQGIKLITIPGHVRGPESAPLKPKTKKVYKVVK